MSGVPQVNRITAIIPPIIMQSEGNYFQILSGDIDLKIALDEMVQHFQSYNNEVRVFQVPHHGSIKNWNPNVFNRYCNAKVWPISSSSNSNRHPSQQVVLDIQNNQAVPAWANQYEELIINGNIEFD